MIRVAILKAVDATVGALICTMLSWFSARRHASHTDVPIHRCQRILVIRPGGIGDMIILLPVLRLLKKYAPNAAIDVICEQRNAAALALADLKTSVLQYDRHPLQLLAALRSRRYDVVVDTEQFHHFSAIFARLSNAPMRIGFRINPRRIPLYTHLVNYAVEGSEGLQFLSLLAPLGIRDTCTVAESLASTDMSIAPAAAQQIAPVARVGPYAIIHPAASASYKRWNLDAFKELANRLHSTQGLGIACIGDRSDQPICSAISETAAASGATAVSLAGQLTLHETATLIKGARVFIGADSGLAHLAIALGTPSVVLFGPTDPAKWGFCSHQHAVVHGDLPCAPCCMFGSHKPCRTIACMEAITVDQVLTAVHQVLTPGPR